MNSICLYCKAIKANMICSRCQTAIYCIKDCQLKDWARHKMECLTNKQKNELVQRVHNEILGNIYIMIAHYVTPPSAIFVEINEKISAIDHNSIHFAHIEYCEDYRAHASNFDIPITDIVAMGAINVYYILKDYQIMMCLQMRDVNTELIKNKYLKPDSQWAIPFSI